MQPGGKQVRFPRKLFRFTGHRAQHVLTGFFGKLTVPGATQCNVKDQPKVSFRQGTESRFIAVLCVRKKKEFVGKLHRFCPYNTWTSPDADKKFS
ncbi:hypothetical protein [Luteolibacter pohnpeiensis]|uniref:hypothetical protein n=1 Tax=Luteolibacter pohnpeiensis TaxID=454153 RepID=UPI001F16759E|nr:hypothetical protein [Luteolibacter pohnpeiensis]